MAYVYIAQISAHKTLFKLGHEAARSGGMLRDVDLIALVGLEHLKDMALDLDLTGTVPRSFEEVPLLWDGIAGFLSFLGLPTDRAGEFAQRILRAADEREGSNTMGAANEVLAWAGSFINFTEGASALEQLWLSTQLVELQVLGPPAPALAPVFGLLKSGNPAAC